MTVFHLRPHRGLRQVIGTTLAAMLALTWIGSASAAPFAAFVMDGRTGKEIHSQNADARLHPASLTKMMTLYMAFTAVEQGKIRLDSRITVSSRAANEPPSRLGLRAGQQIELRYLIRAAAVKSANDAATAIGEGLAGSEAQFGAQMTAMARALGMRNSNFRNANGLTADGHYSSARDMTLLGRRLFYDFPQYYNIFSRRSADAKLATVRSTNARFLDSYEGADGIKTGYTRAAGFNLTASAQRGQKRIIATVMGGASTAQRNSIMAELLDVGFGRAPTRVAEVKPTPVASAPVRVRKAEPAVIARATPTPARPEPRSAVPQADALGMALATVMASAPSPAAAASTAGLAVSPARSTLQLRAVSTSSRPASRPEGSSPEDAQAAEPTSRAEAIAATVKAAVATSTRPRPSPKRGKPHAAATVAPTAEAAPIDVAAAPRREVILAAAVGPDTRPAQRETVSRVSSAGQKRWGVDLGRYTSQHAAEQILLKTALQEAATLDGALRKIADGPRGFDARFVGMTQSEAALACEKLSARSQTCAVLSP